MNDDLELIRSYATHQSDLAFETLVGRYVNLVYSAALRQVRDPHLAEEVTQAVFIILARKAGSLGPKTVLPSWLHRTACFAARDALKTQLRRSRREQEAYMQTVSDESRADSEDVWLRIAPLLDTAVANLGDKDRHAIVLRFFENKSLGEVGRILGANEDAARMRVNRALEKLRKFFAKRGVVLSTASLASLLAANSATAAPAQLATTLPATAAKGVGLAVSTSALVKGTLKVMAWAKWKMPLGVGVAVLVVGGAVTTVLLPPSQAPLPIPVTSRSETPPAAPQPLPIREPFTPTVHMTLGSPPGAVALQTDGKIVIGTTLSGWFVDERSGVLGSYRRAALRFDTSGMLDRTFFCQVNDLNASDAMRSHLELLPDGRLLMSGLFQSVNEIPRRGCAMLLPDGRVDESFEPFRGTTNEWNGYFRATATRAATLSGDGSVAVMSGVIEKTNMSHVLAAYRLDDSGRVMTPPLQDTGLTEFGRPSGLVLTLGELGFWARRPVDWTQNERAGKRPEFLAGLPSQDFPFERWTEPPSAGDAEAVFRALFAEVPIELCRYAVRLPDGGAVLAVRKSFVNGSRIGGGSLMRFDKDWRPDLTFTNYYEADIGSCITLKLQKDGKILVAGIAGKFNGEEFPGLVRLEKDGSIDRSFRCETTEQATGNSVADALRRRVIGLAIQDDGRIVISGFFTKVNGVDVPHLARLNPDGSPDETFRTPFTSWEGLKQWRRVAVVSLAKTKRAPGANSASKPSDTAAPPQTVLITSLELQSGVAVVRFTGNPRQSYILQAGDSLESTEWTNLSTNRASASGAGIFRDPSAKSQPMRLYRIASP